MKIFSPSPVPIVKGERFSLNQCLKNDLKRKKMRDTPYASAIESFKYAQVCTRPDIAYVVRVLGRRQSNPRVDHWKAPKKVMHFLQGTKHFILAYRRIGYLQVNGYSDADYAGYVDSRKSTSGYVFPLENEKHEADLDGYFYYGGRVCFLF